jgi:hypothetical protein
MPFIQNFERFYPNNFTHKLFYLCESLMPYPHHVLSEETILPYRPFLKKIFKVLFSLIKTTKIRKSSFTQLWQERNYQVVQN